MSEMVERVASAIAKADREWQMTPGANIMGWSKMLANAAIEAMREPTEGMLKAADSSTEIEPWPVDIAWRAMIDEALK